MDGIDLREYQNSETVENAFSALVSGGKPGYKTVIEKKKEIPKCHECDTLLDGMEKFCPQCGTKLIKNEPEE